MIWAYELLDIPLDADATTIKRAYARLLHKTRPDKDAAAFQRLNAAYHTALARVAKHLATPQTAPTTVALASHEPAPVPETTTPAPSSTPRLPEALSPTTHVSSDRAERGPAGDIASSAPELSDTAHATANIDSFYRAMAVIAIGGDADILCSWLDTQPELWSLPFKHAFARILPTRLSHSPIPMPSVCYEALISYFQLDDIGCNPDKLALGRLGEHLRNQYLPIAKYKTCLSQWPLPRSELDRQDYLAKLREICTRGDEYHLHAWLLVTGLVWPDPERQHASAATLDLLRQATPPIPRTCFETLRMYFQWPNDVLDDQERSTSDRVAESHLRWLMLPANECALAHATMEPYESLPDLARVRTIRRTLSRFTWWEICLHCIDFKGPSRIANFIYRLCLECKLESTQLLSIIFDPKALRFWLNAAAPAWKTREKSLIIGCHALALLVIEIVACVAQIPKTTNGVSDLSATDLVGILMLSTICVVLPITIFFQLLAWQARPAPSHIPMARFHASVVPWICLLCVATTKGAEQLRPVAYGLAIAAGLLALARCASNAPRYRWYAVATVLTTFIVACGIALAHGQFSPGPIAGVAFALWIISLATPNRASQSPPGDPSAAHVSINRQVNPRGFDR